MLLVLIPTPTARLSPPAPLNKKTSISWIKNEHGWAPMMTPSYSLKGAQALLKSNRKALASANRSLP